MLEVKDVHKSYSKTGFSFKKERLHVLNGVSFSIKANQCIGLIGESGSGKSTLSRLIVGLEKPDKGEVLFEGINVADWRKKQKGQMSIVFQNYTSSVNPRKKIKHIVGELLHAFGIDDQVERLIQVVGLPLSVAEKYPHELSGGQLQRVCIARAISTKPRFLVLDEAISSLDVSIQAQILELLHQIKESMSMAILFIAHDLQAVAHLCEQVMFLHQGQIVEQVETNKLTNVQNNYAKKLLQSVIP